MNRHYDEALKTAKLLVPIPHHLTRKLSVFLVVHTQNMYNVTCLKFLRERDGGGGEILRHHLVPTEWLMKALSQGIIKSITDQPLQLRF